MKIALAQCDFPVGDMPGNFRRALDCIAGAKARCAAAVLFPELAISGYPPQDLLLRPGFMRRIHELMEALVSAIHGIDVIIGHPWEQNGARYNAASWIRDGKVAGRYYKHCLPNYAVFDERRYFSAGHEPLVLPLNGVPTGVLICEDSWESEPARQAKAAGAQWLLVPNASPYRDDKLEARAGMLAQCHDDTGLPMVYCNMVGGQDELVFDGRSMLLSADGTISKPGPLCAEALLLATFDAQSGSLEAVDWPDTQTCEEGEIYTVLVRGLPGSRRRRGRARP